MSRVIDYDLMETELSASGSSWTAPQAHGLLCSRLSLLGRAGIDDWLVFLMNDTPSAGAETDSVMGAATRPGDAALYLHEAALATHRQLSERQSEFEPLLSRDFESSLDVATSLAQWCEGFLHGLVSGPTPDELRSKLAAEPISDIIKDMLEMTRAAAEGDDDEEDEAALVEIIEYVRVATQLVYEELADLRNKNTDDIASGTLH